MHLFILETSFGFNNLVYGSTLVKWLSLFIMSQMTNNNKSNNLRQLFLAQNLLKNQ